MKLHEPTRRAFLGSIAASAAVWASSDKSIVRSVKAMEAGEGLRLFMPYDAIFHRWRGARVRNGGGVSDRPAISPDGMAMCWGNEELPKPGDTFLTLDSLKGGLRTLEYEGHRGAPGAISSRAEIVIARALSLKERGLFTLLAFDLRSGPSIQNITSFLAKFPITALETARISGPGTLVALGSREDIQVIEIPSGKTVYTGPGRFPRLSPDGQRLAFIDREHLHVRSLTDGSTTTLLPGIRVMGAGGFSPDGRYLLAGAWTRLIAMEKRQVVVDTTTGRYGVLDTLPEGDYGDQYAWISSKLMVA